MNVITCCLLFRLVNALVLRTSFAPDEYWQSLEVAHKMVFGYGYLTWEWVAGLRGFLHPTMFAILYRALDLLGADSLWLVAKGPMLLQATFAAATDVSVYKISKHLFGQDSAKWALVCQLLCWFNFYCLPRTYSSCMEACLTTAAVYYLLLISTANEHKATRKRVLLKDRQRRFHQQLWLTLAWLAVLMRPPCALFWAVTGLHHLAILRHPPDRFLLLVDATLIGLCCIFTTTVWDRINYGKWVFAPLEFFRFNLLHGRSLLYGCHPWHWNVSQGFPAIAGTFLPLILLGIAVSQERKPVYLAVLSTGVYSLAAHKEFRFLLPALQLTMPYCGSGLSWLIANIELRGKRTKQHLMLGNFSTLGSTDLHARHVKGVKFMVLTVLFVPQVLVAFYFAVIHHRGTLVVPKEIHTQWVKEPLKTSVLFLMPCHATPWYSHVHAHVPMQFLDCSPPEWKNAVLEFNIRGTWLQMPAPPDCFGPEGSTHCANQQEVFNANPKIFIEDLLNRNALSLPTFVIAYEKMLRESADALHQHKYRVHRHIHNCWWQTDEDQPCLISVWKLTD